jgi:hypothetical protein
MKITLTSTVVAGQPTANGRLYSRECLEAAVNKAKEEKIPLMVHMHAENESPFEQLIRSVIGIVDHIALYEGTLVADVELLETWRAAKFKEFYEADPTRVEFSPAGYGKVAEGKVSEFELKYFTVSPKPEPA